MDTDAVEQRWLTIFSLCVPICGYPAVDSILRDSQLSAEEIDTTRLSPRQCERCRLPYRPSARGSRQMTLEWIQKKDWAA